jgi:hypothetical protein
MKLNFLKEDIPWQHGQELFQLWQSRRSGRRWPARSDISPMDMKSFLKDIMLIDVKRDPLDFMVKLSGTGYRRFMPYDPTGTRVADMPNGQEIFVRFSTLLELGQPYLGLNMPLMWADIDFKRFNGLVLPLGDGGSEICSLMLLVEYL